MRCPFPPTLSVVLVLLGFSIASPAQAHDYWLRLDSSTAIRPGTDAEIRMWVGDKLSRAEEDEYSARKAKEFVHVSAAGTSDLKGLAKEGMSPVIVLPELSDGGHLVAMTRSYSHITLPGWKFSSYLSTEDFDDVLAARKEAGATWSSGRERYSRYLKMLLQVGSVRDPTFGTVLGQKYEIVLLNDPMTLQPGESVAVQVLFGGKPAANVRVAARSVQHTGSEGRTDGDGRVSLPLSGRGEWLIRSVHMQPCGCKKADWESFWASYHFIQF